MPTLIFGLRILNERKGMRAQATIVEQIEETLRFFDKSYYHKDAPLYPERWRNNLSSSMLTGKTPVVYVLIMLVMMLCVVATLWLIL